MVYPGTKDWSNEPLVAGDMDTYISDAIDALKNPPSSQTIADTTDVTTTSTSFEPIGGVTPRYTATIDTAGGAVLVSFHGNFRHGAANGRVYLDFTIDGTPHAGNDGIIGAQCDTTFGVPGLPISFVRRVTGLAAGSHTFVMTWKIITAGTATHFTGGGTANGDLHAQFWVAELT